MAANGCVEEQKSVEETDGIASKNGFDILGVVHKNGLLSHPFAYSKKASLCVGTNGSSIVECIGRLSSALNNVNGNHNKPTMGKLGLLNNNNTSLISSRNDLFQKDNRGTRIGRVGSTDSVVVSSSDLSSNDSSSLASDGCVSSAPCSPDSCPGTPQPMPPIPPSLYEDDRHHHRPEEFEEPTPVVVVPPPCSATTLTSWLSSAAAAEVESPASSGFSSAPTSSSSSSSLSSASSTRSVTTAGPETKCQWAKCEEATETTTDLLTHIREAHVETQQSPESRSFVCMWAGCKVFNKPSSSRAWLERHVVVHGGSRPFPCIVATCSQRFATQSALERHVNAHFNHPAGGNGAQSAGGAKDDSSTPSKLFRKRRLRFHRRCAANKRDDFFDAGIMEHVREGLARFNLLTGIDTEGKPGTITLYGTIIAKKCDESGKAKFLLHWSPENILEDSWVPEPISDHLVQTIPLTSLSAESLVKLGACLPPPGKRRRK